MTMIPDQIGYRKIQPIMTAQTQTVRLSRAVSDLMFPDMRIQVIRLHLQEAQAGGPLQSARYSLL